MLDLKIAFSGIERLPRNTLGTIFRVSVCSARLPAAKVQWELCFFTQNSIKRLSRTVDVMTTGWTKSGGMNNGWDGRLGHSMLLHRMSIMHTVCKANCSW